MFLPIDSHILQRSSDNINETHESSNDRSTSKLIEIKMIIEMNHVPDNARDLLEFVKESADIKFLTKVCLSYWYIPCQVSCIKKLILHFICF